MWTVREGDSARAQSPSVAGAAAASFYNGPANCCELLPRLAVDAQGNAYVTGRSTTSRESPGGPSNEDIATIKYDPQGNELWARRFDGEQHSTDEPYDIALDPQGNVYVTGFSVGNNSNFVTLKYDADGTFQWARYAGPVSQPVFTIGLALDVDAGGNVYATGREAYRFLAGGTAPVYRIRTVKYDTNGNEQWQRTFDTPTGEGAEPGDIKADSAGNVYVAGTGVVSRGASYNSDIYLVKYDALGAQQWATPYGGATRDEGVKLQLAGGSAYVLGRLNVFANNNADVAVLKYTAAGQIAQAGASNRPENEYAVDFAVDGAGNAYPIALLVHPPRDFSPPELDTLTYKFDAAGALVWRSTYVRLGSADAESVVLDGAGGVFVGLTAPQNVTEWNPNYFLLKYNAADGARLSEQSFDGPGHDRDALSEIKLDPYGNLFLTGSTDWNTASPRSTDFMTLKVATGRTVPPTGRVNVALAANGATASASSQADAGRSPAGAINGDRAGRNWGAGGGWHDATADAFPDWLEVNFDGAKTIAEVDVFSVQDNYPNPSEPTETQTFSKYGLADFEVLYWDGAAWAAAPGCNVAGNNRVWRKFTFAPLTTTKIRVVARRGLAGYSRVAEVEAWTESSGAPPGPRVNHALAANGATANASSEMDAGRAASGAINGDRKGLNWGRGGGWHDATANAFPDWLQVNFAGAKTISEIAVFSVQDNYTSPSEPDDALTFSRYGLTAFEVQYWNGTAWVTVPGGSVAGNNKVKRAFTFAPLTTDRIRVLVNNSLAGYSRITEVEAY